MQISRIRLSDKTSRLHPRHVVPKPAAPAPSGRAHTPFRHGHCRLPRPWRPNIHPGPKLFGTRLASAANE
jgi:hypothetical protein